MAEDTINAVQREMGGPVTPCLTKQYPLAGATGYDQDFSKGIEKEYSLPADAARHLAGKFGTRASNILELLKENPSWKAGIAQGLPVIQAEIVYCIRNEMAETVEDLLARRTGAQMYGWKDAIEATPVVASLLAREKEWDSTQTATAVTGYLAKIRGFLQELELGED
jgi:glycerol-3-phosphate dehydrogenase